MLNERLMSGIILLSLLVITAVGVGSYYYGHHEGFASGYAKSKSTFAKPNYYAEQQYPIVLNQLTDLTNKYNNLVSDYNSLRSAVIRYVGSTNYQARQPISCTTYTPTYSNLSTTKCY